MKPAPFVYFRPGTVDEALGILSEHGGEAKILGGGQSMVPLLNFRLARPEALVDINRLGPELDYIRREEDGTLAVGALTRHRRLERSPLLASSHRLLREAIPWIGEVAIRNRGTVGGSVAHSDPTAELNTVLLALDGEVVVRGPGGDRREKVRNFVVGSYATTLGEEEMIVEVRFPPEPEGSGSAFLEISRRHGDFALVGVAACLSLDAGGRIEEARLSVSGAGEAPRRMEAAEEVLSGKTLSDEVFAAAARAAGEEAEPVPNLNGGEAYRRNLVHVFCARALGRAAERIASPGGRGAGNE
jgi:CO/xanthine dehydrogenase FAD-binding subunit